MPFYDYRCSKCNYSEEIQQSIKEEPITKCPKCKKNTFERVIGNVTSILKGSGFYKNDYKGK